MKNSSAPEAPISSEELIELYRQKRFEEWYYTHCFALRLINEIPVLPVDMSAVTRSRPMPAENIEMAKRAFQSILLGYAK